MHSKRDIPATCHRLHIILSLLQKMCQITVTLQVFFDQTFITGGGGGGVGGTGETADKPPTTLQDGRYNIISVTSLDIYTGRPRHILQPCIWRQKLNIFDGNGTNTILS